jgi:hypothetical protein
LAPTMTVPGVCDDNEETDDKSVDNNNMTDVSTNNMADQLSKIMDISNSMMLLEEEDPWFCSEPQPRQQLFWCQTFFEDPFTQEHIN